MVQAGFQGEDVAGAEDGFGSGVFPKAGEFVEFEAHAVAQAVDVAGVSDRGAVALGG